MADLEQTPASGAYAFFADLIPDLAERSREFIVELDVIDEEIRTLYADQIRDMVASLAEAPTARNADTIRAHAHSLEGTGGTMGFPEISIVGWELSQAVKAADWERCSAIAERLARWSRTL
jgi:hypothetical protein